MHDAITLDISAFLLWSTFVLICGMGTGLGAYAVVCEFFVQRGYRPADREAEQRKADELWAQFTRPR